MMRQQQQQQVCRPQAHQPLNDAIHTELTIEQAR